WKMGQRIHLPDSRQVSNTEITGPYSPRYETNTVAGVSADGKTITLTTPLIYDHKGARNADGVLEFFPHVANFTRNVVFTSENPSGTRGHTLFTHRADVDIRYASFYMLGRTRVDPLDVTALDSNNNVAHIGTNQIARYPAHFHHCMGPVGTSVQFVFVG